MSNNLAETLVNSDNSSDTTETNTQNIDTSINNESHNDWYWNENIKGEGEKPDWYLDKYKNIAEQAKAYPEARKTISKLTNDLSKVNNLTGAPEEYEIKVSEEYEDVLDKEDPATMSFLEEGKKIAKELNLNQEVFNKFGSSFVKYLSDIKGEVEEYNKSEIEKLGVNGKKDVMEIMDWVKQSHPTVDLNTIKEMMVSADAIKALQTLRSGKPLASIPKNSETIYTNRNKLKELLGDKRYKDDLSYRKMVDDKYKSYYGK